MKKKISYFKNGNRGEITIDAVFVVIIVVICLFFLLDMTMVVYEQYMVSAAANDAAECISRTYYASGTIDPFYQAISEEQATDISPFRHIGAGMYIGTEKNKWLAEYLLTKRELTKLNIEEDNTCEVICQKNEIGLPCIYVKISRKYKHLFNALVFFDNYNPDFGTYTVSAAGTAVCYDMLYQLNQDSLVNELNTTLSDMLGDTKIAKIAENIEHIKNQLGRTADNIQMIVGGS